MSQVDNLISEELNLATAFTIPKLSIWREAAEAALKGADFEKKLYTQTLEKITLRPLYTESDTKQPTFPQYPGEGDGRRAQKKDWLIAQEYLYSNEDHLIQALKEDQEQGLECAEVKLDYLNADSLETLFQNAIHVPLQIHSNNPKIVAKLPDILQRHDFKGGFSIDPLGTWLNGETNHAAPLFKDLAELYKTQKQTHFLEVSGLPYHNAGAHAAQELAFTMAGLIDSVEQLKAQGLQADQILPRSRISLGAGVHFFMELSKFRAARILLKRICQAYDVQEQPQIHARTGTLWLSLYDPYVNFLRQTVGSLAAVAGGADAVSSGCFNERSGQADTFARRLARNLQLILKNEVHLNQVIDPAGGSYFIEELTTELAEAAWKELQAIETQGGMLQALQTGEIQKSVKKTCQERLAAIKTRKQVLIGTSAYADPTEKLEMPHICASWPVTQKQTTERDILQPIYLASDFETLRRSTEKNAPSVLLLGLGTSQDWLARSDFSRAFFQIAGCNVLQASALDLEEALKAIATHQTKVIVLCSSDQNYQTWLPELLPTVKNQAPQSKIVLAGKPQLGYQKAAIDQYIYLGCDVLKSLQALL